MTIYPLLFWGLEFQRKKKVKDWVETQVNSALEHIYVIQDVFSFPGRYNKEIWYMFPFWSMVDAMKQTIVAKISATLGETIFLHTSIKS